MNTENLHKKEKKRTAGEIMIAWLRMENTGVPNSGLSRMMLAECSY